MRCPSSVARRVLHLVLAALVGAFTLWTFAAPASAAAGLSDFSGTAVWENGLGGVPFGTATLTRTGFLSAQVPTDQSGAFAFDDIPNGTWRLLVRTPCGVEAPVDVTLPSGPVVVQVARQHEAFGYRCRTSTQGVPLAGTPLALTGDDATETVPLPFSFPFYSQEVSAITVSTNGWISATTGGSAPTNTGLPSAGHPDRAVYAFWDDLVVDGSASVKTRLTGSVGAGTFEIQWVNVSVKSDPSQRLNIFLRLNELDGSVVVYHNGVGTGLAEQGSGATIGIEGPSGVSALQVSRDAAVAVNGRSYIFVPEPSPPTADAGADRNVPSQGTFSLDASDSSDADGGGLTFSWVQVAGPATPLDDPTSVRPRATAPRGPATLSYRVTVRDLSGLTDVDDVTINVQAPASK